MDWGALHVAEERLELRPARDTHVERLGGDEGIEVEEVEVVVVHQVAQQLRQAGR